MNPFAESAPDPPTADESSEGMHLDMPALI
jgi:hypothetical protein